MPAYSGKTFRGNTSSLPSGNSPLGKSPLLKYQVIFSLVGAGDPDTNATRVERLVLWEPSGTRRRGVPAITVGFSGKKKQQKKKEQRNKQNNKELHDDLFWACK